MEKQHQRFFDFLRFCILIPGLLVILAIMYIMQEVFGMPASRLIVPPNEKYGKFVLNEVLEAGNFGKHDKRNRLGKSQLGHNLQRVYRDMRLVKYFPAEALCEPIYRTWHFFWRLRIRNNKDMGNDSLSSFY